MKRTVLLVLLGWALGFAAGCGEEQAKQPEPAAAPKPATPAVPPEIEAVVNASLGREAEALVWGDLAKTGEQQVIVIQRLKTTPKGQPPGILFSRLALLGKQNDKWVELLRCDDHVKNPKGFLAGTPLSAVGRWRLQYEQHEQKGLSLYFTPIDQPAAGYIITVGVRWNPKVKRYQSLDRNYEKFLPEASTLTISESGKVLR